MCIVSLLDDVIAEREQFISIKDTLLNISFNNNEPLHDVAYYLSVMYDSIEGLDLYHFDGFNFSKDEQASNHFELLLYKVLDSITIGSGRDWVYSGKYSSFGDYWGDGEGLLKILNSYPYSYFKKTDINNNEILSRLVSFDTKTPTEQLADAHAQIADLKSQLIQSNDATVNKPAPMQENATSQLNDHTEKSYQTTIGLLLELMTTPKGIDGKAPFQSQATIIGDILDKDIQGQRKTTLENRFRDANLMLTDAKKKRPKPN